MKYMNRVFTKVTGGKTKIIYFDDQKIRKCPYRDQQQVVVYSIGAYAIKQRNYEFAIKTSTNRNYAQLKAD